MYEHCYSTPSLFWTIQNLCQPWCEHFQEDEKALFFLKTVTWWSTTFRSVNWRSCWILFSPKFSIILCDHWLNNLITIYVKSLSETTIQWRPKSCTTHLLIMISLVIIIILVHYFFCFLILVIFGFRNLDIKKTWWVRFL